MLKRLVITVILLAIIAVGLFYVLTIPKMLAAKDLPDHKPDVANGAYVFNEAGCASCHVAPNTDDATKATELPGGLAIVSPFGTFHAPNISPDKDHGIGAWTNVDFVNAVKFGVSPDGRHYYPAFPYTSFQRMTFEDLIDLKAYLDTLPPVSAPNQPHVLPFPVNFRRGVGLWKLFYTDGKTFQPDPKASAELNRGAYLVTGPAHCGECHSPRNAVGGIIESRALGGAQSLDGKGTVPNITPHKTGIGSWTTDDIVEALTTGFTPDFDALGGDMVKVTRETRRMTDADRAAIAAYLHSVPPVESARQKRPED